jgi:hypothetical protein
VDHKCRIDNTCVLGGGCFEVKNFALKYIYHSCHLFPLLNIRLNRLFLTISFHFKLIIAQVGEKCLFMDWECPVLCSKETATGTCRTPNYPFWDLNKYFSLFFA